MPISFSSGLVTRGYGPDHRIVTRGMSMRFDFGGIRPSKRKIIEYDLDITTPIFKTDSDEVGVYSSIEMRGGEEIYVNSNISKEVQDEVEIFGKIDHSPLVEILDEI